MFIRGADKYGKPTFGEALDERHGCGGNQDLFAKVSQTRVH
jgi:hypothetical protein